MEKYRKNLKITDDDDCFLFQHVSQIEADLRLKSTAYNSLKGNLQNLERKAT